MVRDLYRHFDVGVNSLQPETGSSKKTPAVAAAVLYSTIGHHNFYLATMMMIQRAVPFLLLALSPASSFVPRQTVCQPTTKSVLTAKCRPQTPSQWNQQEKTFSATGVVRLSFSNSDSTVSTTAKNGYNVSLMASVAAWTIIALVGLSRHPVRAVQAATSMRHNCFTIAQALAFPIPVLIGSFATLKEFPSTSAISKRLTLGVVMASLWTAAAVHWGPSFSVGYDLFSSDPFLSLGIPLVQVLVAAFTLSQWKGNPWSLIKGAFQSVLKLLAPPAKALPQALATAGLFALAMLPQMVAFPTATIPTLLGKRLSRAASGFTFLGAIASFCLFQEKATTVTTTPKSTQLSQLQKGLGWGAFLHIALVLAKIVGLDGGGLLLPGRGLWKDYPSLVKASKAATGLMMVTYSLLVYTCFLPTLLGGENSKK